MPKMCFSYTTDVPPGVSNRDDPQAALRDPRRMGYPCFSYPAELRRMPFACFSYPPGVPPDAGKPDVAEPAQPGLRGMTFGTCFRY